MWDLFLRLFQKVDREYYENNPPELPVESHSLPTPEKSIGEYKILQGYTLENGKRWSTEWLLSEYVKNTDDLIGKMDGTIPLENQDVYVQTENGLEKENRDLPPPDKVIYLDKSARPIEWEVKALWDTLARVPGTPYEQGQVPKRPDSYFLNIDKEDWLRRMGVEQKNIQDASDVAIDYDSIPHEELSRIRALFATSRRKGQEEDDETVHPPIDEDNLDEAWERETIFDGQHVMVVDEVMSSGQTLDISKRLLTMAFPEATFSGQHWARPKRLSLGTDRQGKMQFKAEWVPIWYSEDMVSGRGIGDRNPQWAKIGEEHNKNIGKHDINYRAPRASKVGRSVLSTPHHDPSTFALTKDIRGDALREDFKQMAADLKDGKILYRPSAERDDFEERIEAINHMSFTDWKKKRERLEPKSRP